MSEVTKENIISSNVIWDIESIYPSIDSNQFRDDFSELEKKISLLEASSLNLTPKLKMILSQPKNSVVDSTLVNEIQEFLEHSESAQILFYNLYFYLHALISIDFTVTKLKSKYSELQMLQSRLKESETTVDLFLSLCDKNYIEAVLSSPKCRPHEFIISRQRLKSKKLLSEQEENLIIALNNSGHKAWSELYDNLCGQMKCELKFTDRTETVGLSVALSYLKQEDSERRAVAWRAVQEAWGSNIESAAAIVNALAGWRHAENKKRSINYTVTHLDAPLHRNCITRSTLEAIIEACRLNLPDTQAAGKTMAKLLGSDKLEPWDMLAPCPITAVKGKKNFKEAIDAIKAASSSISSELAEFIELNYQKNWIDGRVLPNKATGAYCTQLVKAKEPRVFMTYMGSNHDVMTLAHELGHAYHYWLIKDLPFAQQHYPSTLAETASVFLETVLGDYLFTRAESKEEQLEFAWGNAERALAFLINIPARFEFEDKFHQLRLKRTLSPEEICKLNNEVWTKWYGDVLTKNDNLFWTHKLHFHMAGPGFYNFPYTFGYLFSLAIYARREQLGSNFFSVYKEILRDTGRMTAEDLIKKHLGENIETVEFWQKSISVVKNKLVNFEQIAKKFN